MTARSTKLRRLPAPPIPVRKTPLVRVGIFRAVDWMGSVLDVFRKFPAPPIPDFLYSWESDTRKLVLLVSENMYVDISVAINIRTRLVGNGEWGGIPMEVIDFLSGVDW
jgi:hypothetical protein